MSQREILFKAKRTDNGEWVEGWYCKDTFGRWPVKHCIIPWENAENGYLEHVMVDGNTVCQYTGLTDKNGKKIFEGDKLVVCLDPETKNGIVKYNTDSASFWMDFSGCFSTFLDFEIAKRKVGEKVWIQITGNIYDN